MKTLDKIKSVPAIMAAAGMLLVITNGCVSSGRPHETLTQDQEDRAITSRVESAFQGTDYKYPDVKVETINRTVELKGSVDTAAEKDEAGRLAELGIDVRAVDNRISVR
jgi:osmotically-inducible protein OsmY